jgi:hypothetical protein
VSSGVHCGAKERSVDKKSEVHGPIRSFAEKRLNADAYPDCEHRFFLFECGKCQGVEFGVVVERHSGDETGDFHGVLRTRCANCGDEDVKLSITSGGNPAPLSTEDPECECGGKIFHVGMCERWEDWGFFDEGTVSAMCALCGRMRGLVDTD